MRIVTLVASYVVSPICKIAQITCGIFRPLLLYPASMQFSFTALLWVYSGKGAWHFVTLPKHAADEIRFFNTTAKGFMPVKVIAQIGETSWKTALFPDSKSGSYVLAIKAEIRKKQKLNVGDEIVLTVRIL
jgi:Domain of unknown function (DUF1905)